MPNADVVYISSVTDPLTNAAACRIEWHPIQAVISTDVAFTTARDLYAAAAHAESDVAFLRFCREVLKVDVPTAGHMLLGIRAARPAPTGKTALRIEAVAGIRTGTPRALVHISRGSRKAELSPDEAREMALHWTQTAAASVLDARFRYALGEWDHLTPAEIERLSETVASLQR